MTLTLDELNTVSTHEAAALLRACCGAERWVIAMVARRPFPSVATLVAAADDAWNAMGPSDWLEAFAHHPRIGERRGTSVQDDRAANWSMGEQATVATAGNAVHDALALANEDYERRFGHIYIVCASGKSADELLAIARARLHNDPATELRVAAEEQRKIMHLRLRKLISEPT